MQQHIITFEGLVFRPFEDRDAASFVVAARESVASLNPWMPWCHDAFSKDEALAWFQACREAVQAGSAHEFGIFHADTAELLGGAGLNGIVHHNLYCNLGYWVRTSAQRRGVALRSVQALSRYAFEILGLQRVEIVAAQGNVASEGVAIKAGAQLECLARNRLHLHGRSVPASVFSLVP
ncbi:MAG: GNAT family N-acetyltransferase [Aquabacterium sp.]